MRCLVIADVHANLAAFEAVLSAAGAWDEVWSLGDLVGYGPDPDACIELLRRYPHAAVAGNHDWAGIGRLDLGGFNACARAAAEWTAANLSRDGRRYLRSLPTVHRHGDYTLVHGSLRLPVWEYIDHPEAAWENMRLQESRYCLVGHTHVPALYTGAGRRAREALIEGDVVPIRLGAEAAILNPGSVGQPRDGDPRASFLLLDTESGEAELHRVDYAVDRTQERMEHAGLPARNAMRLAVGR